MEPGFSDLPPRRIIGPRWSTVAAALWCTALLVATHRAPFLRIWMFRFHYFSSLSRAAYSDACPASPLATFGMTGGVQSRLRLTVPLLSSRRALLVLDAHQGQTFAWAVEKHIVYPALFAPPRVIAKYPDGELWEMSRR